MRCHALAASAGYFFGREGTAAQRLQRLRCGLSLAPHLAQRRSRRDWTKLLCGRVLIVDALLKRKKHLCGDSGSINLADRTRL
jgi:hypothetical protein